MRGRRRKKRLVVHTESEICGIRRAAQATAWVRDTLAKRVHPGMTTLELDKTAENLIREAGGASAFHGYHGFPGQICISLDDVIVHGIGRDDQMIRPGQLVSMDVGVRLDGFIGDSAVTVCAGICPSQQAEDLLDVTQRALNAGINAAQAGGFVGDIGRAVETVVRPSGFSIVRDFVGHGVGCDLHEPPEIPNFAQHSRGVRLVPGMVLAIEPMINAGVPEVTVDTDGWTARTRDGALSAHFEHDVLITQKGPEILSWQKKQYESKEP